MQVTLIQVPYDSGHYALRMGGGPLRLTERGLAEELAERGHEVELVEIRLPEEDTLLEVRAAIAVERRVLEAVRTARAGGSLPLVLAGNCNYAAIGTTSALAAEHPAVVWFDAHGDFNTPDTSPSGFFDGMALSVMLGDAWRGLHPSFADFAPVDPSRVALVGARDVDAEEARRLESSDVSWVSVEDVRGDGYEAALDELSRRSARLYLHVDLDVLDRAAAQVNPYSCDGGLTLPELLGAVASAGRRFEIAAASLTSFDPTVDEDDRAFAAAKSVVDALVAAAGEASV